MKAKKLWVPLLDFDYFYKLPSNVQIFQTIILIQTTDNFVNYYWGCVLSLRIPDLIRYFTKELIIMMGYLEEQHIQIIKAHYWSRKQQILIIGYKDQTSSV